MMTRKTATIVLASFCFCTLTGAIALRIAWATPAVGVVTTNISGPIVFDPIHLWSRTPEHLVRIQAEGLSDVYVKELVIAPGGQTGWHGHPGPAFVSVKSGVATEYSGEDDTCSPVVHLAGTGFMETSGHVHNVRNEGTDPLDMVVLFLVPQGAPPRLDMPNPGNCPF